jgi:hypothetical protein
MLLYSSIRIAIYDFANKAVMVLAAINKRRLSEDQVEAKVHWDCAEAAPLRVPALCRG